MYLIVLNCIELNVVQFQVNCCDLIEINIEISQMGFVIKYLYTKGHCNENIAAQYNKAGGGLAPIQAPGHLFLQGWLLSGWYSKSPPLSMEGNIVFLHQLYNVYKDSITYLTYFCPLNFGLRICGSLNYYSDGWESERVGLNNSSFTRFGKPHLMVHV